jgi:hypothetical protein
VEAANARRHRKESIVEARNSWYRNTRERNKPSFAAAATLLGIYTAVYLAFAGLVHFMTSPDAAASIVQQSAPVAATAAVDPAGTTGAAAGSIATRPLEPEADETDNARECRLDAGIDTACIFD